MQGVAEFLVKLVVVGVAGVIVGYSVNWLMTRKDNRK